MHWHEYAEICKKKYAEICKKYANICICPVSLPQLHIYAKICKKYAKYASMKFICIICTPHFADVDILRSTVTRFADTWLRRSLTGSIRHRFLTTHKDPREGMQASGSSSSSQVVSQLLTRNSGFNLPSSSGAFLNFQKYQNITVGLGVQLGRGGTIALTH